MHHRCITNHLAEKPDYVTWHFEERVRKVLSVMKKTIMLVNVMILMMMAMVIYRKRNLI